VSGARYKMTVHALHPEDARVRKKKSDSV